MRAFIIRPFGIKSKINFDAVEESLISPALERLGVEGRTTIDILRQGNIRVDMFQRLLTADLVIADLSIHNANVFYELGIRHGLRDKRTFLLRCDADKYPFDLQTDRYFTYNKDNPSASLEKLVEALQQTIESEAQDSPVFKLLPDLQAQDRARFLAVPVEFREEVERALANGLIGDLELLGEETQGLEWESEGLRLVGRAQFHLMAYQAARTTWEALRKLDSSDLEANIMLGTIYQRLGDLTRSDQALKRALNRNDMEITDRAEAHSIIGRNAKTKWKAEWGKVPLQQQRQNALRSPFLEASYEAYSRGFNEDLHHFYSGLSALAMLTIQTELASGLPEVWAERFDTDEDAKRELVSRNEQMKKLATGVEISLKAAKNRSRLKSRSGISNFSEAFLHRWLKISKADLLFLTSKRPPRVATAYRNALAGASDFTIDSVRSQLEIYQQLGVMSGNVKATLSAVIPLSITADTGEDKNSLGKSKRVVIFTGHRIDAPGTKSPRFPDGKKNVAKEAIMQAVLKEKGISGEPVYGIAGGASGGDIIFHEVCVELGIPTRIHLAVPRDDYVKKSVAPAGPEWVERLNRLYDKLPVSVLSDSPELPRWLQEKPNYSIWQRNNLWILHNALAESGAENVTLIALWNGKKGDGPGGTADLVQKTKERGVRTMILDTKKLFGA